MKKLLLLLGIVVSFILLSACQDRNGLDARSVHYDRDMCARCAMVVSDRHNTAQVINPHTGKVYKFDDIGCTILWFEEEHIPWKNEAVIWVTDVDTGEWIDAKKAYYDTENLTPMAYGFSAHKTKEQIDKSQEVIDYQEVVKRVKKFNR